MLTNYYAVLGLTSTCTKADIKTAYHICALLHHPDKNGNTPEATTRFQKIQKAYETLARKDLREDHDAELQEEQRKYAAHVDDDSSDDSSDNSSEDESDDEFATGPRYTFNSFPNEYERGNKFAAQNFFDMEKRAKARLAKQDAPVDRDLDDEMREAELRFELGAIDPVTRVRKLLEGDFTIVEMKDMVRQKECEKYAAREAAVEAESEAVRAAREAFDANLAKEYSVFQIEGKIGNTGRVAFNKSVITKKYTTKVFNQWVDSGMQLNESRWDREFSKMMGKKTKTNWKLEERRRMTRLSRSHSKDETLKRKEESHGCGPGSMLGWANKESQYEDVVIGYAVKQCHVDAWPAEKEGDELTPTCLPKGMEGRFLRDTASRTPDALASSTTLDALVAPPGVHIGWLLGLVGCVSEEN